MFNNEQGRSYHANLQHSTAQISTLQPEYQNPENFLQQRIMHSWPQEKTKLKWLQIIYKQLYGHYGTIVLFQLIYCMDNIHFVVVVVPFKIVQPLQWLTQLND